MNALILAISIALIGLTVAALFTLLAFKSAKRSAINKIKNLKQSATSKESSSSRKSYTLAHK